MKLSEKQIASGGYKQIDGVWHKLCNGIAHEEPTWLPATEKYFIVRRTATTSHKVGSLYAQCRLCNAWRSAIRRGATPGTEHGRVPINAIRHIYIEAANRIGVAELALRAGMQRSTIVSVIKGNVTFVRKSHARRVMLELISIRRHGEHSISELSRARAVKRSVGEDSCVGCGTHHNNYTIGCHTCDERKSGRVKPSRTSTLDTAAQK